MTQPVALHRITTQYVAEQDRLRLSAQDEQGYIHLYWLTQRLANQLVSHLGGVLTQHTPPEADLAVALDKEASTPPLSRSCSVLKYPVATVWNEG